jgi:hypothetical protein
LSKVVKNMSKVANNCQKIVIKMTKGSAMHHWSFYVSREAI